MILYCDMNGGLDRTENDFTWRFSIDRLIICPYVQLLNPDLGALIRETSKEHLSLSVVLLDPFLLAANLLHHDSFPNCFQLLSATFVFQSVLSCLLGMFARFALEPESYLIEQICCS